MIYLALFLIALWLVAVIAFKATVFAVHLLLVAGLLLAIAWGVRHFTGHHEGTRST